MVSTTPASTGVPAVSPNRRAAAGVTVPAMRLPSITSGSSRRSAPTASHSSSLHPLSVTVS